MASKNTVNPQFSSSETTSIAAGATATSDAFTMNSSGTTAQALVKVEADNDGTPASGDEVEVYLLRGGDPDNDSSDEYDTAKQGELVLVLDTNDDDPAVRSTIVDGPFPDSCKLYFSNESGGRAITVSAEIIELIP